MSSISDYLFAGIAMVALFVIVGGYMWSSQPNEPTDIVPAINVLGTEPAR
ncbi:hypothetical protein [Halovulum marinum]|nr:hypothetical protein [Halovulum marinum]